MIVSISIFLLFAFAVMVFMRQPQFGKMAAGDRLKRIKRSPNFSNGKFQNIHNTPDLTEGATYYSVLKDQFFAKDKRNKPAATIPSIKTDLHALDPGENILVWFGHSSYFLQVDGKTFLVDPVFSGNASPIGGTMKSYKGTDVYDADDIPVIDYLLISHDHWDHLDYDSLKKLRPKIKKIITGLGVGAHLQHWGFAKNMIEEKDWNETVFPEPGFVLNITPARHFSGRGFKRQQSLWVSFVLQTPSAKLFIGGDSGYDTHFKTIGEEFGPFDLAILECGQYNLSWKYIHMLPEEVVQAAVDLNAYRLMPVHWAKFSLAHHAWDDPILRVTKAAEAKSLKMITPLIGEKIALFHTPDQYLSWWKEIG